MADSNRSIERNEDTSNNTLLLTDFNVGVGGSVVTAGSDITATSAIGDTTERDPREKQIENLKRTYEEGITVEKRQQVLDAIKSQMKIHRVYNKVKFLSEGSKFGRFDRPDFTENCWQNIVFKSMPNLRNLSDSKKAIRWMTYRSAIKTTFSNEKNRITHRIKGSFTHCKYLYVEICRILRI